MISKYIGLIAVGIYSNYILIVNSLNNILQQLFNAITSSIGNLVVTNNERSKAIYEKLNFFNFYIYSLCSICLFILINPFMNIWLGQDYVLSFYVSLCVAITFYIAGMQSVTNSFRSAYGLFYKAKFRPIIMVIINLVVSIILVQFLGIPGVLIGTISSRLLTTAWLDPYVIYKYGFKDNVSQYYKKYMYYLIIVIASGAVLYGITSLFIGKTILGWLLAAIVVFIVYNLIIFALFRKTEAFRYFLEKATTMIKKLKRKEV